MRILDMLDEFSVKATFFVLGWVAEREAALVREIKNRGHEIACHGYGHKLVYNLGRNKFRDDTRKSKKILEDICGIPVNGYRATSYSITKESLWALDILIEEGFLYDSSVFPISHDIYGMPGTERFSHDITRPSGIIKEFPITTFCFPYSSCRIPVAGGGYLRLLPVSFIRHAISYINTKERQPAVVYFHPWEIDPGQPRIRAGMKSRFRHYVNLDKTENKIRYLLSSLKFKTLEAVLSHEE
jgi:polysaccharide deacetylase family protein (PEP-CTERM system associated)